MGYLNVLFKYEWELVKSPAGAHQWLAKDVAEEDMVVDAHDPSKKHRPMMTTADLSLRFDPIYEPIARRYQQNPEEFADAFARAWFKLTHRDMGPRSRYLGPEVPAEELIWQDPVPAVDHKLIDAQDIAALKGKILASGLSSRNWSRPPGRRRPRSAAPTSAAARTGRAFAWRRRRIGKSTSRPNWRRCCKTLEGIQKEFNSAQSGGKKVSLADLIVLGGCAAVEQAAKNAGHDVTVPFTPGRTDASQEQTDVESFAVLEPAADGFRNYLKTKYAVSAEELLVDRAQLLTLTAP
jgi:catalase-peroxidase